LASSLPDPISKNNNNKKKNREKLAGGVTLVLECMFCKQKALSSNPSPTKKTKDAEKE
jgi:hypothetical protein